MAKFSQEAYDELIARAAKEFPQYAEDIHDEGARARQEGDGSMRLYYQHLSMIFSYFYGSQIKRQVLWMGFRASWAKYKRGLWIVVKFAEAFHVSRQTAFMIEAILLATLFYCLDYFGFWDKLFNSMLGRS